MLSWHPSVNLEGLEADRSKHYHVLMPNYVCDRSRRDGERSSHEVRDNEQGVHRRDGTQKSTVGWMECRQQVRKGESCSIARARECCLHASIFAPQLTVTTKQL